MTTAAMVCAMAPLAFGQGSGASERTPVGVVLIGGLVSSIVRSLLVVPVFYSLLDDVRYRVRRHQPGSPPLPAVTAAELPIVPGPATPRT